MTPTDTEDLIKALQTVLDEDVKASTKAITASTKAASGIKLAAWSFTGLAVVIGFFALEVRNATIKNSELINTLDKRVIVLEKDVETILRTTAYEDR
jgi:hypothetical protein